jgi:hypothetical protein
VGKSGERFFVKALSSLFWKKFWIFFRRGVMEAYKFRFSASQSGTEKVFEGGKWVRREPGYLTASMLAPLLKPLAGYPNEGKEEFLAALDRMMPDSVGPVSEEQLRDIYQAIKPNMTLDDFRRDLEQQNRRASFHEKWILANVLIIGVLLLLAPTKGRRSRARKAARTALAEFETTQEKRVSRGEPAWLLLPFLQGAWQRSTTVPFVDGKQFGFEVTSRTREDAVFCELLLMITYNVRQLRVCPHCLTIHWRKETSVCEACKREQDRIRKARQEPTPKSRFRNKVSQAKSRKSITADQATLVLETLDREGLFSAERLYGSLLGKKPERSE